MAMQKMPSTEEKAQNAAVDPPGVEAGLGSINEASDAPYSAFTKTQKRWILALVALAGWFSSLSSFIYFPAIPAIAADPNESIGRINLTVTAYLIMSGIFPSIVADAADTMGRRPVFIVTLAVYVAANIGLALQTSFGLLFFLRMAQSAGISGSYAVTYGVIGDLFTPAERGGYSGLVSFALNTPPSIGPVISGLLLHRWGWRAIFWFLSAISPCCLLAIVFFLPETSRRIVEDGSVPHGGLVLLSRPLMPFLTPPARRHGSNTQYPGGGTKPARSCRIPNPLTALILLKEPGTAIVIGSAGIWYTIYSCLQASLSSLFTEIYQVSGLVSGLSYLPFGIACAISAYGSGRVLDIDYRHTAARYGISVEKRKDHNLSSFPIEEARLRSIKYSLAICCILTVGYGWSLQRGVHMAVPLVLQFFIGLSMQGVFTVLSTLLVDLHPDCPSTAQAGSNLIRCELAAGGLAVLDVLLRAVGPGWCFVLWAGLGLVSLPCLYILERRGLTWRQRRSRSQ
ncbi:major facilitator superfamily domain-containing protein [Coniochaeta sp. 2T2.1]|nr:major facilitator superfamily domain-containing protein [Coniochaeta sp. 2T2.1]